jgi:DNA-binding CsgD family transcriptional regulator
MLTVYEDADHIFNALAAGASGYLLKQTPRTELLEAIEEVHQGGSPMTSNIARKVVQSFQKPRLAQSETENLSKREQEVLDHLARGFLYKEIADVLRLSVPTVSTYIRRIYESFTSVPGDRPWPSICTGTLGTNAAALPADGKEPIGKPSSAPVLGRRNAATGKALEFQGVLPERSCWPEDGRGPGLRRSFRPNGWSFQSLFRGRRVCARGRARSGLRGAIQRSFATIPGSARTAPRCWRVPEVPH